MQKRFIRHISEFFYCEVGVRNFAPNLLELAVQRHERCIGEPKMAVTEGSKPRSE